MTNKSTIRGCLPKKCFDVEMLKNFFKAVHLVAFYFEAICQIFFVWVCV